MKKAMLLSTVILLAFMSSGYAQDAEMQGTFKLEYSGKYIWRGFNVFGAKFDSAPIRHSLSGIDNNVADGMAQLPLICFYGP